MGTSTASRTATAPRRPRADASRNHERIVCAALQVLIEQGAEAPMDEIARRAGVGNATLYRHFPDRAALVRSVTLAVLEHSAELAERALADHPDDPVAALREYVHSAADHRIGAACSLLSSHLDTREPELALAAERGRQAVDEILSRGRLAGRIRGDVAAADVLIALAQLTRPLPGATCPGFQTFAHRHLDLLLDGLTTPEPAPLAGHTATLEELRGA
ncbi:TetR/AcrR family transcriptional regulator [Phaeacidiphilus oryzae]|jgi:AcrR family transcriptional regulator|uniref:TetR/AcrR family transcriptional regulator n=1 Tax=Phaeacidiphilus oryzae TaxID=348818 RepID=UPI0005666F83|nr:TetR/AcrR family transcriptional regulator [Phaeacidiphilus oryzae]